MRVIVFGASGVQGATQVRALVRAGHHPVAISRDPKPLTIDGQTIETKSADFTDHAAITTALKDGEIIFLNLPSTSFQPSPPIIAAALAIAKAAVATPSIKLCVFNTSMPVPDVSVQVKAQDDRREMLRLIRSTGLPTISIQPVVFLDNLLEGWARPGLVERETIVYCHQTTLDVSWICHHDIAQLMMAAMTRPQLAGLNFPVGGPEAVRLPQLTEILSRAWGRKLKYESQSVDDFCEKISSAMGQRSGLDVETVVSQMRKAYTYYRESDEFNVDMSGVLKELPVKLTKIEEWASTHPFPTQDSRAA
ncbi:hypothetical protein BJ878DRAFT_117820 [Calycina marina]|uniref:NmrA-like domain-containing protein n=1 Tax=Calycina marina TaxID=1763456 RepID=A0A9P8CFL1_9HELO|nr:hypothetical protein BJ878DRAFT_117820 [Calycina marina]